MVQVTLEVNGKRVSHEAPARMHLGDFLRDQARLTGTHLGCEHGVCGACTVLVDGAPVRSCISFAVACEGRQVTTIEGYDADPVMQRYVLTSVPPSNRSTVPADLETRTRGLASCMARAFGWR